MNQKDRKQIAQKLGRLQEMLSEIEELRDWVGHYAAHESEKFDNICERGLESSPMGEALEESAQALEEAESELDEAHTALESAITTLEAAIE
tara:strand:+ start:403 stop:678 length:276 start_codon:yes stop_codon:yes gene_type:complete